MCSKFIKITGLLIIGAILFSFFITPTEAVPKKKGKSGGLSDNDIVEMSQTIDKLYKKIYAASLFSPQENAQLIEIKIKLDDAMLSGSSPTLAPLYYKAGVVYQKRGYRDQAIECYQTILENFSDTALAPKAMKELKTLGVKIETPGLEKKE